MDALLQLIAWCWGVPDMRLWFFVLLHVVVTFSITRSTWHSRWVSNVYRPITPRVVWYSVFTVVCVGGVAEAFVRVVYDVLGV